MTSNSCTIKTSKSNVRAILALEDLARKITAASMTGADSNTNNSILIAGGVTEETEKMAFSPTNEGCKKEVSSTSMVHSALGTAAIEVSNFEARLHSSGDRRGSLQSPPTTPRRTVFKQYWEKSSKRDSTHCSPRKNTLSDALSQHCPDVDIRTFSPPLALCGSLRDYHSLTDNFPNGEVPSKHSLPSLPSALRRWTSHHGSKDHGMGMYPLLVPRSILRKDSRRMVTSDNDRQPRSVDEPAHLSRTLNLELTSSTRRPTLESSLSRHIVHLGDEKEGELRNSLLKAKKDKGKHTHFDPRIVITEFDDHAPRYWYSEEELIGFKSETILLAQQYMSLHPELCEDFNNTSIESVTGQVRRRTLFSIPVLNSLPEDLEAITKQHEHLEAMVQKSVKKILIVDPNKAILNLFCKSLQRIFPEAQLSSVQTGEEALKLYKTEMRKITDSVEGQLRSFDVVIVEERLNRLQHKKSCDRTSNSQNISLERGHRQSSSFSDFVTLSHAGHPMLEKVKLEKQSSFSNLDENGNMCMGTEMTGSDLILRIRQLESQTFNGHGDSKDGGFSPVVNASTMKSWESGGNLVRALLVGVSVDVDRDGEKLRNSGADMVWGKPPPSMGTLLRNRIVCELMKRRGNHLFPCTSQAKNPNEVATW